MNERPLLEGVGHPVAVNPDRALRRLAAERGWPIHDFRRHRRLWLVWLPSGVAIGASAAGIAAVMSAIRRRPRAEPRHADSRWHLADGGWAARRTTEQPAEPRRGARLKPLARLRRG